MTTAVAKETYARLLARVQKILLEGRGRAKRALEREEVRTWWNAARVVNGHLRIHRGRAEYGKKVIVNLAKDLAVTEVYLYDILKFQRAFPILNSSLELTLSHYRILAKIDNVKERKRLYRKTLHHRLSVPALVSEIRARKLLALPDLRLEETGRRGIRPGPRALPPLKAKRGKFYTYRVVKSTSLHPGRGFYSIDLGFGSRHHLKLTGIKSPKEGDIIESVRTKRRDRSERYRFKRAKPLPGVRRMKDLLYTYKALVKDVHDDDTLWVDADQGFRFWTEQKLRLRGIDAAEIEKGKPASDFVKRTLAQVPFVVITISGRDKWGRPLADLFYLKGTKGQEKVLREGIYLNQQLLDLGLARRV